eukprot:CAMPEP_0117418310 /NCGR_PEP_ID=MMETSP0758-20121206/115_1 /TAXON_ID=63605 /ORGANISM="Percolomonas cosmopolitus, Strain AE-1 (ATCC 50343)" /LENGTH=792 /DNA_ID=CAMNT_0005198733 /DNA_START=262 /DNA_END=2640 /DNA_ORIENTATION=-
MGGLVSPDQASTTYGAVIDQFTFGHQYLKNNFGYEYLPKTGWSIDAFGNSDVLAWIYKKMGFERHVIGRIPFKQKEERREKKELDFLWQIGPEHQKNEIVTRVLWDSYCTPYEFDFEGTFPEWKYNPKQSPPITNENIGKRSKEFEEILLKRLKDTAGNDLFFPLGCDFQYAEPDKIWSNFTKIINYLNEKNEHHLHLKYSVVSDYFKQLNISHLPKYKGDFFTYADYDKSYWSGYFTSRPTLKIAARQGEQWARVFNLLMSIFDKEGIDLTHLHYLNEKYHDQLGILQHHDAITGTARYYVVDDYIEKYTEVLNDMLMEIHSTLNTKSSKNINVEQKENLYNYGVVNTLGWGTYSLVSIPNPNGLVPDYVMMNGINITFDEVYHQTFVLAPFNPSSMYTISIAYKKEEKDNQQEANEKENLIKTLKDFPLSSCQNYRRIESPHVEVYFDEKTNSLAKIVNKQSNLEFNLSQTLMYYTSYSRNDSQDGGAYIFRPTSDDPTPLGIPTVTVEQSSYFIDIIQTFNDWAKQTFRVYFSDRLIEFIYDIGPVPENTDVISRFTIDNFDNDGSIYADALGFKFVKRNRVKHAKVFAPSNYFPMQYGSFIEDRSTQRYFSVIADKSAGVASLCDGCIEVMLMRRTIQDDDKGLGKKYPMNDTSIIRAKHQLLFGLIDDHMRQYIKTKIYQLNFPPTVLPKPLASPHKGNLLKKELPPNLHLLSHNPLPDGKLLLRLSGLFDSKENCISYNATFDMSSMYPYDTLTQTSLNGIYELNRVHQLCVGVEDISTFTVSKRS